MTLYETLLSTPVLLSSIIGICAVVYLLNSAKDEENVQSQEEKPKKESIMSPPNPNLQPPKVCPQSTRTVVVLVLVLAALVQNLPSRPLFTPH